MSHRSNLQFTTEQWAHTVPALSQVAERHRIALEELDAMASNGQSLAVLVAHGVYEANNVVAAFLAQFSDTATVLRIAKPFSNIESGMRALYRSLGVEAEDIGDVAGEAILKKFLAFQRQHRRRTIVCIEQCHAQGTWLLDIVHRLIDLEAENKFGLLVLLCGQPDLQSLFDRDPLVHTRARAGRFIVLPPFSPSNTLEFLRARVKALTTDDVHSLFDYGAIARIHEFSGGVPDLVGKLCYKTLQIASQQNTGPVTAKLVSDAANLLWQKPAIESSFSALDLAELSPRQSACERLVVRHNGQIVAQHLLRPGRSLIGRADFAEIQIDNKHVSRRHALIEKSATGLHISDLGSTNGTRLNGLSVKTAEMFDVGDVINIGECRLEVRPSD